MSELFKVPCKADAEAAIYEPAAGNYLGGLVLSSSMAALIVAWLKSLFNCVS